MKSIRISCSIIISAFFPYRTGLCRLFGIDLIVRLHARTPSQNPEYSCPALHFNLFEILLLLLQFNENLVGLILLKQNNLNIRKLVWDNAIFSKSNESEFSFKKSTHMTSDPNCAPLSLIHLIPKWRPINMLCLLALFASFSTSKFFYVFFMLTRHQGLINMQTKE